MRKFYIEHKLYVLILFAASLWVALFSLWKELVLSDPLDVSISLAAGGAIEQTITIFSPESYALNYSIARGNRTVEELELLMGSMRALKIGETHPPPGIYVPIQWDLTKATDGSQVASGNGDSTRSSGWSDANVSRTIGYFSVPPGRYKFHLKILSAVPEFASVSARIVAQTRGSASSTWQMSLVWWGSIGTYLVAWPAAILVAIFLIYRGLVFRSIGAPTGVCPLPWH